MEKIKERIYKTNEVVLLREKFYQFRSSQEGKSEKSDQEVKKNIPKNVRQEVMELNEKIKVVIKEMLTDLRDYIYSVLEASNDIKRIFLPILLHLYEDDPDFINFEEIHKEEFSRAVQKDEFLKIIFLQINANRKTASYEELVDILLEIEDNLRIEHREMTKFKNFISMAIEKSNMSTPVFTCNNCSKYMKNSCVTNHNCHQSHQTQKNVDNLLLSKSMSMPLKKEKDTKFKDIDDLLDYINSEEVDDKPKKTKKKNNKKDKKSSTKLIPTSSGNLTQAKDKEKLEKEIEEFRNEIQNNSINAFSIHKIRPRISKEFLLGLNQGIKLI